MIFETEHWKFTLVPRFVRKPYDKLYKEITCIHCNGRSSAYDPFGEDINCTFCHNTGKQKKDVTPKIPPPPEITPEFIDHMRKAFNEFKNK